MEQGSLRHVLMTFHDPYSPPDVGWHDRAKMTELKPAVCKISGWLLAENEDSYIVASTINEEVNDVSMLTCLPRGCVVEIKDVT